MLDYIIELAHRAGALLLAGLEHDRSISFKSRAEVVTDMDRASEQLLVNAIRERYPQHRILAEEGSGIDQPAEYTWLIDPLDGTNNYAHGFPVFAVSLALLHGETLAYGVIYDPTRRELFSAERGRGAWLNGRRLHVSTTAALSESLLTTGFPYNRFERADNNFAEFMRVKLQAQGVRRPGSAALDLAYVAAGRTDGYWELGLHPWDIAAGALLVGEAGGRLSDWQGRPWSVWNEHTVASNGLIHEQLVSVLNSE